MLETLLGAWILSWFGFDNLFVKGFNELFNRSITNAGYYIFFVLIGVCYEIVKIWGRSS